MDVVIEQWHKAHPSTLVKDHMSNTTSLALMRCLAVRDKALMLSASSVFDRLGHSEIPKLPQIPTNKAYMSHMMFPSSRGASLDIRIIVWSFYEVRFGEMTGRSNSWCRRGIWMRILRCCFKRVLQPYFASHTWWFASEEMKNIDIAMSIDQLTWAYASARCPRRLVYKNMWNLRIRSTRCLNARNWSMALHAVHHETDLFPRRYMVFQYRFFVIVYSTELSLSLCLEDPSIIMLSKITSSCSIKLFFHFQYVVQI